jgi:hypothetical protein
LFVETRNYGHISDNQNLTAVFWQANAMGGKTYWSYKSYDHYRILNHEKDQLTTIAISRKNHLELSELCKKGQSFDNLLTQVLMNIKESNENKDGQSKFRVGTSCTLTANPFDTQTAIGSDSNDKY